MPPQSSIATQNPDLAAPKLSRDITARNNSTGKFLQEEDRILQKDMSDSLKSPTQKMTPSPDAAEPGARRVPRPTGSHKGPPVGTKPMKLRSNVSRGDTDGGNYRGLSNYTPSTGSSQLASLPNERKPPSNRLEWDQSLQTPPLQTPPSDFRSSSGTSRYTRPSMEEDRSSNRSWTPSLMSTSGRSRTSSVGTVDRNVQMNENELADAIIASSLASKNIKPRRGTTPPPVPPHRRRKVRSLLGPFHTSHREHPRPPSPRRGMPLTLRNPEPPGVHKQEKSEGDHGHKMHIIHKHPHKHHEGDRKRWRSEVTEQERRRYEGVWAANKGLLIPIDELNELAAEQGSVEENGSSKYPPDPSEMVLNLVVRDIWSRSGLPREILEKIWDLVDGQGIGLLRREEFVVGMWLIDQQLKGRKLPARVPQSVWDSVRHSPGIKVPLK